jgi:hypothetical protein
MKKSMMTLAAVLCCATVTLFSSCSDSGVDDNNALVVNNSEMEVSINRLGGQVEFPVEANGSWTVKVDDEDCDWAQTWTDGGKSGGIVTLNVDYLDPRDQKQERKTTFTVTNGSTSKQVTLRQYIGLKDGETADNAATQSYPDLWFGKGVGKGLDPLTGNFTANNVLNPKGMITLTEKDPSSYGTLFSQTPEPHTINDIVQTDTLEDNQRGLGVFCAIDVKYAKFKLNVEVDYKNSGKQIEHTKRYQSSQDLAFLKSSASVADVAALIVEDLDEVSIRNKKTYRFKKKGLAEQLVSVGFQTTYGDIVYAFDNIKGADSTTFKNAVNKMLDDYGPVIINGATLGGSVFTAVEYDSTFVSDSIKLDSAKVTAGICVGAVQIGAKVNVKYQQLGSTIWENSHHYCEASGGDKAALVALVGVMNDNFVDRDKLNKAAEKWMSSIVSSNNADDNTSLIKCQYTPIWNIFPDDVAQAIKPLVVEKYRGKKLCTIKPEDMGFTKDDLQEDDKQ